MRYFAEYHESDMLHTYGWKHVRKSRARNARSLNKADKKANWGWCVLIHHLCSKMKHPLGLCPRLIQLGVYINWFASFWRTPTQIFIGLYQFVLQPAIFNYSIFFPTWDVISFIGFGHFDWYELFWCTFPWWLKILNLSLIVSQALRCSFDPSLFRYLFDI